MATRHGTRLKKVTVLPIDRRTKKGIEDAIARPGSVLSEGTRKTKQEAIRKRHTVLSLVKNAGFVRLTPSQIIAEVAKREGLTEEKLKPYLAAIETLRRMGVFKANGRALLLYSAIKNDLLAKLDRTMTNQKEPFNSIQLAKNVGFANEIILGGEPRSKALAAVTRGMGILGLMGRITKLPVDSRVYGGPNMWIHTRYRETSNTLPVHNKSYQIMQKLRDRPKYISDLIGYQRKETKKPGGVPDPIANLSNLISSGLVRQRRARSGKRTFIQYALTETGERIMREQEKTTTINEQLRIGLLGMPVKGLSPFQKRRYGEILNWIKLLRIIDKHKVAGKISPARVAREAGRTVAQVNHVFAEGYTPLQGMKENTANRYLQEMKETNPIDAKWFEEFLRKKGILRS